MMRNVGGSEIPAFGVGKETYFEPDSEGERRTSAHQPSEKKGPKKKSLRTRDRDPERKFWMRPFSRIRGEL